MPSIVIKKSDLFELVGRELSLSELEDHLCLVKGELKRGEVGDDELKVELNDTNRPDTWCVEGIARQIRYKLGEQTTQYGFFSGKGSYVLNAEKSVRNVRPVVGAFVCRDIQVTDYLLEQIIQTQEKLCENFGSKRRAVAIGVYNLDRITFPVIYRAVSPTTAKFVPLGFDYEMTLAEILEKHPKGVQYAHILSQSELYPLLTDSLGHVLSFPPVINSRLVGEVTSNSRDLFIEATGDDLSKISLALNILAYNLADRGGKIEGVTVNYEEALSAASVDGAPKSCSTMVFPNPLSNEISASHSLFEKMIGETIDRSKIIAELEKYGCHVVVEGESYRAKTEEYRFDYLHPIDLVEDYAMSRGYQSITPDPASCYTLGGLAETTEFGDKARAILVGLGFEEIFLNMLMSKEDIAVKTMIQESLVEIENVMTENYGVVRNSLLPGLMGVEAVSGDALYPHRVFEVGEVAICDPTANHGNRTVLRAALLIGHPKSSFSEVHSCLEHFLYYLGYEAELEHCDEPWLIPGRGGKIFVRGNDVGRIGEIHPQVLSNWDIRVPLAVCEIYLDRLICIDAADADRRAFPVF